MLVHDEDAIIQVACCHCCGTGTVASEVSKFDDAEQVLKQFADWITAKRNAPP